MGTQVPPPKKRGTSPNFRPTTVCIPKNPNICCGQMTGLIKVPLGTKVGIDPGDIVLDGGTQLPLPLKRGTVPNFRRMSIVAKRSPILATAEHL